MQEKCLLKCSPCSVQVLYLIFKSSYQIKEINYVSNSHFFSFFQRKATFILQVSGSGTIWNFRIRRRIICHLDLLVLFFSFLSWFMLFILVCLGIILSIQGFLVIKPRFSKLTVQNTMQSGYTFVRHQCRLPVITFRLYW
jgi:hypothetical protein